MRPRDSFVYGLGCKPSSPTDSGELLVMDVGWRNEEKDVTLTIAEE